MKNRDPRVRFTALSLAVAGVFSAPAAFSQVNATPQLKETVVTANRVTTRTDELVSDVVVINRTDIEKQTGRTLSEILARAPGVQFSSNGGLGKSSSVNIRGSEARHTILLIDGVRFGSATTGTPSWDNIPVDMIERIEILKGPASALYGSEAVGGVIQIFMRKGAVGFRPYVSVTLGSLSYRRAAAGFSGGSGDFSYTLGAQKTREVGFSATNSKVSGGNFNPDRDGFDQNALNAAMAYQINPSWKLDAGLVYVDSVNQSDDGLNRDTRYAGLSTIARAGVEGRFSPSWKTRLSYSQSVDSNRAIVAAPALLPSLFRTTQDQLTWQNDIDTSIGVVMAGVEQLGQKVDSTTVYKVSQRDITSYLLGINGSQGRHSWQANLRRDNNSQFGVSNTGFIGYGLSLSSVLRLNLSTGSGFVAPTFNQLYFPATTSFKGNPLLQPERSHNTDVGITWSDAGQSVKLVVYDNKITDIITTVGNSPVNVSRARIKGTTLAYEALSGPLAFRASVDVLNPRNEVTGKRLQRRSSELLKAGVDYTAGSWTFGGSVLRAGDSFNDAANAQLLDAYLTTDLYADYKINTDWKLQAKLNNLSNSQYETIRGLNQPGRAVYLTLRYQPK
jgi:vitamin B12 transporter